MYYFTIPGDKLTALYTLQYIPVPGVPNRMMMPYTDIAEKWFADNNIPHPECPTGRYSYVCFENEEHATLFKLRWL